MICIIGATGNVGKELVDQLVARGERIRIVTRDEKKVAHLPSSVERIIGNATDRQVLARAFDGVTKLFSLSFPGETATHSAITEEAKRAGVRHIVLLSSIGASSPYALGQHHRASELVVEASGLARTFVRPGYFMSNTLAWAASIKSEGKIVTPTADGKVAPIAPRDIAEIAAIALTGTGHEGKIYELTGDEPLSQRDQVAVISRLVGKPIACVEIPFATAAEGMRKLGRPEWLIDSLTGMWEGIRAGKASQATDTFQKVTGRRPQSFEMWATANRAAFA